ncbi:radical SAM protein [Bradyrhizobium sp. CCBAU 51753]|uniref:radical SAM protein n=1 Tax=Bradyrhizobium sp. CCBAU 51753 TaxID=1325100 RepID=UPI00188AC7AF|nr:radical SAM protein [Bradyrhizobium sp. CCBAU 51753]QOZ23119.1 hypothetical protein XH93_05190 [Bradyrhizobium sp. CCBAU 51753]
MGTGDDVRRMWRPRLIILQPTPYCNINCTYCYLPHRDERHLMSLEVLDAIKQKLFVKISPNAEPIIVWHAGEPMAAPLSWYRDAFELLKPGTPAGAIYRIQTNGISVSDEWIDFLSQTGIRIGVSIDGPPRFHDARRVTRQGRPTSSLVIRNLRKLQAAGLEPNVLSVLHPTHLSAAEEFYQFYREHQIYDVSFSIDEITLANPSSSFSDADYRAELTLFLLTLMKLAFADGYPLRIREVERVAGVLASGNPAYNEQTRPWDVVAVAANGDTSSFSPEFLGMRAFNFGNVLHHGADELFTNVLCKQVGEEIERGVSQCSRNCGYFNVCGGGSPSNKFFENGSMSTSETLFCRLSVQAPMDALRDFLRSASQGGEVV